jgi:hypothetical protein
MDRGGARRLGGCITGVIRVRTCAFAMRVLRFPTSAEVGFGVSRVGLVMSVACPVYPEQQTFQRPVGTSHLGHERKLRR